MNEKTLAVALYIALGLTLGLVPLLLARFYPAKSGPTQFSATSFLRSLTARKLIQITFFIIGIGVLLKLGYTIFSPLTISLVLLSFCMAYFFPSTSVVEAGGFFLVLCLSVLILWWVPISPAYRLGYEKVALFSGITFILCFFLLMNSAIQENRWINIALGFFLILLSIYASFFTAGLEILLPFAWHHWSAYIASAELLLSGAMPFIDFPMQYGLGPSLIIASVCHANCWEGMYWIVAIFTLLFFIAMAAMSLSFAAPGRYRWFITALICFIACFFWTAFPPSFGSVLATPSVSGLRFLPAAFLTLYLFYFSSKQDSTQFNIGAHALWIVGALWSPESLFYVTFIWWPFYLFLQQGKENSIAHFLLNCLRLAFVAGMTILIFLGIYWIIFARLPSVYGYFAYAINPPGPLPINPFGAIWFFITVFFVGSFTLWQLWKKVGGSIEFRRGYLVLLLLYATFSYFLGRSHDNNILNLMPFMALVLFFVIEQAKILLVKQIGVVLVASTIGWLSAYGWSVWDQVLQSRSLLQLDPLLFSASRPSAEEIKKNPLPGFSGDAQKALLFINTEYREPATVLDNALSLQPASPNQVWSAIHDPANYVYIPSVQRRQFLKNTQNTLQKPGWLIISKDFLANDWLVDFDRVYKRTNTVDFETYYAIRFEPN